jgi:hypothetical protein
VLRGISPLVWRRLLVRADSTVAGLHAVLQIAFGWSGEHLHRFVIHGSEYGISSGGACSSDDAREAPLDRFGLRVGERFAYEYDLSDGWWHDVRVEAILAPEPGWAYPRCLGGRRAGPPEDCGGPWAFLEQRQQYSPCRTTTRVAEIIGEFLDDPESLAGHRGELSALLPWMVLERFDRRAVNLRLAQHAQRRAE